MDVVRRLVLLLLMAGGLVVAAPGAAHACSCTTANAADFVTRADAVVWARVADVQMPAMGNGQAHYLLEVDTVHKGATTERLRLDSEASGAACGLEGIEVGRRYVFFLRAAGGEEWRADLCGGTGEVRRAQVVSLLGAGRTSEQPEPGGPQSLPPSAYSYAGMGLGGLAALATGAVLWRRRSSGAA